MGEGELVVSEGEGGGGAPGFPLVAEATASFLCLWSPEAWLWTSGKYYMALGFSATRERANQFPV